jgi:CRISPR-associated exonuclease Cas4
LSGKPDYVIRTRRGAHVPVEIKSYRGGARPPHADLVQLGAYLLLLEDLTGKKPQYGILRYRDRTLRVPYTEALRAEVLRLLEQAQRGDARPPAAMPHPSLCRPCPFAPICDAART